jgi:hypothetical protein
MTLPDSCQQTPRAHAFRLAGIVAALVSALWAFVPAVTVFAQNVPGKPIIVTIPPDKPKSELSGLADVLIGSLGLTGIIVIAAVLMGAIMAALMFWVRSRAD